MTPAQFIEKRKNSWVELEKLINEFENKPDFLIKARKFLRFARLYRAVCTDMSLSETYRLPDQSQSYLQSLVSRSHSVLYSLPGSKIQDLIDFFTHKIPLAVYKDPYVWICQFAFFLSLGVSTIVSWQSTEFTRSVLGEKMMNRVEEMHSRKHNTNVSDMIAASSWYVWNNASIDLQIFCMGILAGIGSLLAILFNGVYLGSILGFLLTGPASSNILCWVTAHAPFELFAIGLSGGAGLRIGYSVVAAEGRSRLRALQEEARSAIPVITAAISLTILAAFIEAFLAPRACGLFFDFAWALKLTVMSVSILMIVLYFYGLGFIRNRESQIREYS